MRREGGGANDQWDSVNAGVDEGALAAVSGLVVVGKQKGVCG